MNTNPEIPDFQFIIPYFKDEIATFEKNRKAQVFQKILHILMRLGLLAASLGLSIALAKVEPMLFLIGIGVGYIAYFMLFKEGRFNFKNKHKNSEFERHFDQAFNLKIAQLLYQNVQFEGQAHVNEKDFNTANLFKHYSSKFSGEDLLTGFWGKTQFAMSEVHAQYETEGTYKNGERRTVHKTFFQGVFLSIDANKNFQGSTYILPDFAQAKFGNAGAFIQKQMANFGHYGELITLENPEFERHFKVLGNDPIEARYLLTPDMMQRLVALKKQLNTPFFLSFRNNRVYLALALDAKTNFLDPHLSKAITKPEDLEPQFQNLLLPAKIIEALDLNTRIWTKS